MTADRPTSLLDDVLAELATEQAGLAESLRSLTDCAAGSLDVMAEPALTLAEETLAHARASVLIASYLVRMIDGHRRCSGSPPAQHRPSGSSPATEGYRADAAAAG
ncbi:hypothetical protein [Jatrophihabitans sp.]|uniref:hypothetical protein n=1 Tax=Jatrophihabitans sp. TaxID=1932789 RepID=UPI002CC4D6F9|nr:hypothetical protein [Jatrophihabitans sp.]